MHHADNLFSQIGDDYPEITIPKGWGHGKVEAAQITCWDHVTAIKNMGFYLICVPSVFWNTKDEEFRNKTSLADDSPNTTDIVMRQLMHMSEDNHYPKLKRKSLAGGPNLDRFMGRVIPPSAAEADMKTGQRKNNSDGTIASAFCPHRVVDHGFREFILDSGASVHLGQESLLTSPEHVLLLWRSK